MTIYRVIPEIENPGDGSAWTSEDEDGAGAYSSLATVLPLTTSGDEIWIAQGNVISPYTAVPAGVKIYGGFSGLDVTSGFSSTEEERAVRNHKRWKTVIDGGGTHQGLAGGIAASVTIDGIYFLNCHGSAINTASFNSWTISNCVFRGCTTDAEGGAIRIGGGSSWTVTKCTFGLCSAVGHGGAVYAYNTAGTVSRCRFVGNSTEANGGALYLYSAGSPYLILQNLVCHQNYSAGYGGAIAAAQYSGGIYVVNNTVERNSAVTDGGGIYSGLTGAGLAITNCIVRNNRLTSMAADDISGTATTTYSNVPGPPAGTGNIDEDPPYRTFGEHAYEVIGSYPGNDAANTSATGYPSTDYRGRSRHDDPFYGSGSGGGELWDDGDCSGTVDYTPTFYASRATTTTPPYYHTTPYGLRISSSGGETHPKRYVYQDHTADLTTDLTYRLIIWVYTETENPVNNSRFHVKMGGDTYGDGGITLFEDYLELDTWTEIVLDYVPESDAQKVIHIGCREAGELGNQDFWVDDISLKLFAATGIADIGAYEFIGDELDYFDYSKYLVLLTVDMETSDTYGPFTFFGALRMPYDPAAWNENNKDGRLLGIDIWGEHQIEDGGDELTEIVAAGTSAIRHTEDAVANPSWVSHWGGGEDYERLIPSPFPMVFTAYDDGQSVKPIWIPIKIKLDYTCVDPEANDIRVFNFFFSPRHTGDNYDDTDYELDSALSPGAALRFEPDMPWSAFHVQQLISGFLKVLAEGYSPLDLPLFGDYNAEQGGPT
jgi:predicted outer membrane repeat protein